MHASPLAKYLDHLKERGGSARQFAQEVGVDPSRMSRYLSGEAIPANDVAAAMEEKSGGKVPREYWEKLAAERRAQRRSPRRSARRTSARH